MNKIIHILTITASLLVLALPAQAASSTNVEGQLGFASRDARHTFTIQGTANFVAQPASASNDVQVVIRIPSNSVVNVVHYRILSTNTAAALFKIGDNNTATQYVLGVDGTGYNDGASPPTSARYFGANGDIRVTVGGLSASNLIMNVTADVTDFHRR